MFTWTGHGRESWLKEACPPEKVFAHLTVLLLVQIQNEAPSPTTAGPAGLYERRVPHQAECRAQNSLGPGSRAGHDAEAEGGAEGCAKAWPNKSLPNIEVPFFLLSLLFPPPPKMPF